MGMGEEIIMSTRTWTAGWDIYGPTEDVVKHEYVRMESPKFWETVNDLYDRPSIHNELTDLILQRIKYQLKFRDSLSPDKIKPQSLLQRLDTYGLGKKRPLEEFLR